MALTVASGRKARPHSSLACSDKEELRQFARENKIQFREDATNAQLNVPRNRVRNELLPLLRKNYQPALNKTVLRLMEIVGAESDLVSETARRWLARRRPAFQKLPIAIQRRVLQAQLLRLGVPTDFDLVELLRRSAGVSISVSPKLFVSRNMAGVVNLKSPSLVDFNPNELALKFGDRVGEAVFAGVKLSWRFESEKGFVRPSNLMPREFLTRTSWGTKSSCATGVRVIAFSRLG